tara:strand:- start:2827 stop:3519 length:693 start_codon:yes stop_codon:yes gene_type:complete
MGQDKLTDQQLVELVPEALRRFGRQIEEMAKYHDLSVSQMARLVYPERGELALKSNGVLTLVLRHPAYGGHKVEVFEEESAAGFRAVVTMWRQGTEVEDRTSMSFSMQDALDAELANKGAWKFYRKHMLVARAIVFAAKSVLPDALMGLDSEDEMKYLDDNNAPRQKAQASEVKRAEAIVEPAHRRVIPKKSSPHSHSSGMREEKVSTRKSPSAGGLSFDEPSGGFEING